MAKKGGDRHPDDSGPSLLDWLRQRLRFGRGDDTGIVFIPSHERDNKTRVKDQE